MALNTQTSHMLVRKRGPRPQALNRQAQWLNLPAPQP